MKTEFSPYSCSVGNFGDHVLVVAMFHPIVIQTGTAHQFISPLVEQLKIEHPSGLIVGLYVTLKGDFLEMDLANVGNGHWVNDRLLADAMQRALEENPMYRAISDEADCGFRILAQRLLCKSQRETSGE